MKWKTALNAEEAAIWLHDLGEYSSLAEAKELITDEPYPDSKYWQDWQNFQSNVNEAVSFKEALWDEIHHAWIRQECGEGRGSLLVLDSWGYSDECCESLSKQSCKVTKESLAAWVYEVSGIDKAKMVYPNFDPKKRGGSMTEESFNPQVLRWKKTLSCEEAALLSAGLGDYQSIDTVMRKLQEYERTSNSYTPILAKQLQEAKAVHEALEVEHMCKVGLEDDNGQCFNVDSVLETQVPLVFPGTILDMTRQHGEIGSVKLEFTKQSLARWFYSFGDVNKAISIEPDFDPKNDFRDEAAELKNSPVNKATTLSPKTKNSYLKTIHALSHALLNDGLSGKDSTDAQKILKKLARKKIDAPLVEKTLGAYLKAARELP